MSKNKDRICFLFPCVIFFETQQGRLRAQLSASSFQQTKVELSTTLCAQQRQGHYHADIGVIRASVFERSLPLLQLQFEVGSHLLVSSPKSSTPIAHEGETSTERVMAQGNKLCTASSAVRSWRKINHAHSLPRSAAEPDQSRIWTGQVPLHFLQRFQ